MYFSKIITSPDLSSPLRWGRAKKEYNQENLEVKINNNNNNHGNDSDINNNSLINKGQVEEARTKQNMANDVKAITHHFLWADQCRTRFCAKDS